MNHCIKHTCLRKSRGYQLDSRRLFIWSTLKSMSPPRTESLLFRRISFALFGAVVGVSYGLLVMTEDVPSGCFGPDVHTQLCGLFSFLLNTPAALIGYAVVPDGLFHEGLWNLIAILSVDALLCAGLALIAASPRWKHPYLLLLPFLLIFPIFSFAMILFFR